MSCGSPSSVGTGELTEARFAASLEEAVSRTALDAYGDADTFFAATLPSGGLKSLLNEVLGRGSAAASRTGPDRFGGDTRRGLRPSRGSSADIPHPRTALVSRRDPGARVWMTEVVRIVSCSLSWCGLW